MRLAYPLILLVSGCGLITVQQDPFPPMQVTAKRPPPGPPRVVLTDSHIQINEKVMFEFAKADIRPESFGLLDAVAGLMLENPQLEKIEVQGHTDSVGTAEINRKLSAARAAAVREYLVKKGVKGARLSSKGFGPDVPLADNATDQGREMNRRVEFRIMKQGPKKTIVRED